MYIVLYIVFHVIIMVKSLFNKCFPRKIATLENAVVEDLNLAANTFIKQYFIRRVFLLFL